MVEKKSKSCLLAYDFKLLRLPTVSILIESSGSLVTSLFFPLLFGSRKEQGVETQTFEERHSYIKNNDRFIKVFF